MDKPSFTYDKSLLEFRRGPFDGQKFFSQSPFRSGYFVVGTTMCLACTALAVFLLLKNWSHFSSFESIFFVQIGWGGVAVTWWQTLKYIQRIRQLYLERSITTVELGSPLDVALGVAAGAINTLLFFFGATVFFLLLFIIWLLKHC